MREKVPKKIIATLKGEKSEIPPIWFMRQAGRYLPEYRALRAEKGGFLEMAFDPAAACEITMQPIRRFALDAAIIFSDILVIPMALGQKLEFVAGEGPKLDALQDLGEAAKLDDKNFDVLEPVFEALQRTAAALQDEGYGGTALFGFAGAPWTVATYMIEGGSSKDFLKTKLMAYRDPDGFDAFMDMLSVVTARYLIEQVKAGAESLQIFDSWAGALDPAGFERFSIRPVRKIVEEVRRVYPDIPIIGFPKGAGLKLEAFARETGVNAIGLDQYVPPEWAAKVLQPLMPVQGNLDPFALMAGGDAMRAQARRIMTAFEGQPYIFNLGHGIHKDTPPGHVEELLSIIRKGTHE